jgi:iduronate 2-sulfatase
LTDNCKEHEGTKDMQQIDRGLCERATAAKRTISRAVACTALASQALCSFAGAESGPSPNILLIPVDDLKPILGSYGDPNIITPNMDRLAARGTVFLNAHAQMALCGPSRASLLTGRYPDQIRIWDMDVLLRDRNPNIETLPQFFRAHGYATTGVSKTFDDRNVDRQHDAPSWSIPYIRRTVLSQRGGRLHANPETIALFEEGMRLLDEAGLSHLQGSERNRALAERMGPGVFPSTDAAEVPDNTYIDGLAAEEGIRLLEELALQESPFFLSVAFSKPHLPFAAPQRYWDLYDRDLIEIHPFQERAENSPAIAYHNFGELRGYTDIPNEGPIPEHKQRELIHGYMAATSYIDALIGTLLDKLDELGIADNTIICLFGDHGWHLGDHGLWAKHSNFEQATWSPLIIAAPGLPGGRSNRSPVGLIDIFPTLADLAGLPIPAQMRGHSLSGLMDDPDPTKAVRDAVMSQFRRTIDGKPAMGYSLRSDRYRYTKWIQMDFVSGERTGPLIATEFYDYETDPMETVSLAGRAEVQELIELFEGKFETRGVGLHTGLYNAPSPAPGGSAERVILNETWADGERTLSALPDSAAWFSSCSGADLTVQPGALTQKLNAFCSVFTYFTNSPVSPVHLDVGQALELRFHFSVTGRANERAVFRFGLFDGGATRVFDDGRGNSQALYAGVQGYGVFLSHLNEGGRLTLQARTDPVNQQLITATAAYTAFEGRSELSAGIEDDVVYTATFQISRVDGETVLLYADISGPAGILAGFSAEDTVRDFHTFDLLAIASNALNGDFFTLHGVEINVLALEEADGPPASFVEWAGRMGLSSADAQPDADPKGAGVSNLLRYALGMDVDSLARDRLPEFQIFADADGEPSRPGVSFLMSTGPEDIHLRVEVSSDLQVWTPGILDWQLGASDGGLRKVEVRDLGATLGDPPLRFYRLQVELIDD